MLVFLWSDYKKYLIYRYLAFLLIEAKMRTFEPSKQYFKRNFSLFFLGINHDFFYWSLTIISYEIISNLHCSQHFHSHLPELLSNTFRTRGSSLVYVYGWNYRNFVTSKANKIRKLSQFPFTCRHLWNWNGENKTSTSSNRIPLNRSFCICIEG